MMRSTYTKIVIAHTGCPPPHTNKIKNNTPDLLVHKTITHLIDDVSSIQALC